MKERRIPKLELRSWVVTILLFATTVHANDLVVRTTTTPEKQAWLGQQVVLRIGVLAADGWAQARLPEIDLDGAYVLARQTQGVRLAETIEGKAYSGQQYEVFVYPQQAGSLRIPGVSLDVEVATFGPDAAKSHHQVRTDPIELEVAVPPGAERIRGLISATALDAKQEWRPAPQEVRVGDAIKRIVMFRADGTSGMAFTPDPPRAIEGVSAYASEPSVDDDYDRGELTGGRTETVTYVFERQGPVSLPARSMRWWNLRSQTLETVNLPGLELDVLPSAMAGSTGQRQRSSLVWFLAGAVALLLLGGWVMRKSLTERFNSWQRRREASEAAYFRRFEDAAQSGNVEATLAALMRWLDRTQDAPAQLDRFVAEYGDSETAMLATRLQRAAYDDAPIEPEILRRALAAARRRWRRGRVDITRQVDLPDLNPAG